LDQQINGNNLFNKMGLWFTHGTL